MPALLAQLEEIYQEIINRSEYHHVGDYVGAIDGVGALVGGQEEEDCVVMGGEGAKAAHSRAVATTPRAPQQPARNATLLQLPVKTSPVVLINGLDKIERALARLSAATLQATTPHNPNDPNHNQPAAQRVAKPMVSYQEQIQALKLALLKLSAVGVKVFISLSVFDEASGGASGGDSVVGSNNNSTRVGGSNPTTNSTTNLNNPTTSMVAPTIYHKLLHLNHLGEEVRINVAHPAAGGVTDAKQQHLLLLQALASSHNTNNLSVNRKFSGYRPQAIWNHNSVVNLLMRQASRTVVVRPPAQLCMQQPHHDPRLSAVHSVGEEDDGVYNIHSLPMYAHHPQLRQQRLVAQQELSRRRQDGENRFVPLYQPELYYL